MANFWHVADTLNAKTRKKFQKIMGTDEADVNKTDEICDKCGKPMVIKNGQIWQIFGM